MSYDIVKKEPIEHIELSDPVEIITSDINNEDQDPLIDCGRYFLSVKEEKNVPPKEYYLEDSEALFDKEQDKTVKQECPEDYNEPKEFNEIYLEEFVEPLDCEETDFPKEEQKNSKSEKCQLNEKSWNSQVGTLVQCSHTGCGKFFKSDYLKKHINSVHMRQKVECPRCFKEYSLCSIRVHMRRCGDDKNQKFFCNMKNCKSSFVSRADLSSHVRRVHHFEPIKCPFDGCNSFMKPSVFKRHLKTVHAKLKQTCTNCGKEVNFRSSKSHLISCLRKNGPRGTATVTGAADEKELSNDGKISKQNEDNCQKQEQNPKKSLESQSNASTEWTHCTYRNCKKSIKRDSLQKHLIAHKINESNRSQCPYCKKKLSSQYMRVHIKICKKNKNGQFFCDVEENSSEFLPHIDSEDPNSKGPAEEICFEDCGESLDMFEEESNDSKIEENLEEDKALIKTLEKRLRQAHSKQEDKVVCTQQNCKMEIMFSSIKKHMKRHGINLGRLTCPNCQKKVHITLAHLESCSRQGQRQFLCTIEGCKATFNTKINLHFHLFQSHGCL